MQSAYFAGFLFIWITTSWICKKGLKLYIEIHMALDKTKFPNFCLKRKQVKCFDYLLKGFNVITVLPFDFGKSTLFQLLPDFLSVKTSVNIVLVVCPLSSIIEDQLVILNDVGICADVLRVENDLHMTESLFEPGLSNVDQYSIIYYPTVDSDYIAKKILDEIYFIETERDLLEIYGIWDENCSSALFNLITMYAPLA